METQSKNTSQVHIVLHFLIECEICDYNAAGGPNHDLPIYTTHGTGQLTAGRQTVHTHNTKCYPTLYSSSQPAR